MCAPQKLLDTSDQPLKTILKRFCIVVVFGIAFGYFEAAVVVYLRAIFYPDGFTFPLAEFGGTVLWERLLLTEVGRETASLVLILSAAALFGQDRQQRFAFFITIFAIWDIFYYIWLKVILNWPSSLMDWDILFLIPMVWASPVLAPMIISVILLIFAVGILYRCCCGRPLRVRPFDWLVFIFTGMVMVVSFCIAGQHITEPDFRAYFSWLLFALASLLAGTVFVKCLLKSK